MMLYQPSLQLHVYMVLFESCISAGFPSPADDYAEHALGLNELLIKNPPATFFARISDPSLESLGLYPNDLIVIDRSLPPHYGKLMLVIIDDELKIRRYSKYAQQYNADALNRTLCLNRHFFDKNVGQGG